MCITNSLHKQQTVDKQFAGQTFYHMPGKMCGENNVRGDTVETGLIP
jgi:hypothetical protein